MIGRGVSLGCPEGWILLTSGADRPGGAEELMPVVVVAVDAVGCRRELWRRLSTRPEKDDMERWSRHLGGWTPGSRSGWETLRLLPQIRAAGAHG